MPRKTVIVVGAGASQEADLPAGDELKNRIDGLLDYRSPIGGPISGDEIIRRVLSSLPNHDLCFKACDAIRAALPQATSIDSFIHERRGESEIEYCGKLAIVRSILAAERKSRLFVDPGRQLNVRAVEKSWFNAFWKKLKENCHADELKDRFSSIALIIFNYDRCLEQFLCHSIQNYYGLSGDDSASLVNAIEIFHPYGTVGSLPWADGDAPTRFGAEPDAIELATLAGQIKTFTEGTDPDASDVDTIRDHVDEASTLVFLGFAYHPQNMDLLRRPSNKSSMQNRQCYGTAHGISPADCSLIERDIKRVCAVPLYTAPSPIAIQLQDLTCAEFFEYFWRSLSFT